MAGDTAPFDTRMAVVGKVMGRVLLHLGHGLARFGDQCQFIRLIMALGTNAQGGASENHRGRGQSRAIDNFDVTFGALLIDSIHAGGVVPGQEGKVDVMAKWTAGNHPA